ncbi:MAG: NAD(P)-dependent oxidoreductase [Dehalococcoidales bacterium]|nr:NAD(P)-dependent oxidoreductase [Dehalococcoidales bacterium]
MKNIKVGFIGLGEMGKPMARNLIKNGYNLTVCGHIRKEPIEEMKSLGAIVAGSPEELAEANDVVVVMVRDIPQTEEVVMGDGFWKGKGIWQGAKEGATIVLCSTLNPGYCRKLAEEGKKKGVLVLDSPVSGGFPQADAGTLTFMVGGDKDAFDRCRPIFEAMGKIIYYLGGSGTGQAMKLVNNYMMVVTAYGTSEAIIMGLKAGLGLEQMLEIIKVSSGNSAVIGRWNILAEHQRVYRVKAGEKSIFNKDVMLAVEFADEMGVKSDFGKLVLQSDESILFPT